MAHPKPRLLVSQCIEFKSCRWNGLRISSDLVKLLKPFVEFVPVCPEMAIGLGVPRHPIRIVETPDEGQRLLQPASGIDCTESMRTFADRHLDNVGPLDGAILKSRSPSCGVKDVRVYPPNPKATPENKGVGVFAQQVKRRFPDLAIEDEGRLTNFAIREHFLTRVFTVASFRRLEADGSMGALVRFHAQHKFLLMAHSEASMRDLGRIVANHDKLDAAAVYSAYGAELRAGLAAPARVGPSINVLQHLFGFFSQDLSAAERDYFLESVDDYRAARVPLSVPVSVLRAWVIRFGNEYLLEQALFDPYPEDLIQITDSGKGRDLR